MLESYNFIKGDAVILHYFIRSFFLVPVTEYFFLLSYPGAFEKLKKS